MKPLRDWLVYLVVRVFICLIQALRMETCATVSRGLAWLASDVVRVRKGVVQENLRHTFPDLTPQELRQMVRQMWDHLFLMVCEIAHAPRKIHDTNWREHVQITRKPEFVRAMLDPRPKVLVSGHFGNFEVTSFMSGILGFSTHAIARRLDNPYLDRFINRFRSANGQYILPKEGSSAQVDEVLRSGGVIALLGDQAAGAKGCWVEFLGRPASCHKAVSLFTLVSGAPLIVAYGRRIGGPLQLDLGITGVADPRNNDPVTGGVQPLTRWYNARLEDAIRLAPEQYWWVHRRWKGQPPKRRSKRAAAAASADAQPADTDPSVRRVA